jgi:transposase
MAVVAVRARMVLLRGQGHTRAEAAQECGVSVPTVDRWVSRFTECGVTGLPDRSRARVQVPGHVREQVVALAGSPPPADAGVERWTTRKLADHVSRTGDLVMSGSYVATVLREEGIDLGRHCGRIGLGDPNRWRSCTSSLSLTVATRRRWNIA